MRAIVNISLKQGVLDPQGQAIQNSLSNLGFNNCNNVRTGKQIILDFQVDDEEQILKETEKMCETLLVNTVIENYDIEIIKEI
ncbi:phosphoribosylformylglycinamidine synthase subunit PurS [Alphaproteobacteria bacterium]|jgi:phosphoribosylformylglycinamidine synthase PurS subunit|nr:phosphoribosylformylglycinamidine synthase subunit PurS [Alphaproteobacteria bacterium]MDC1087137.1 phosphoribosylformylglycinamidine synthase subunit PurS [Alphaproteobacteria bacterium]